MTRWNFAIAAAMLALSLAGGGEAEAQYPARPVRWIAPYPPIESSTWVMFLAPAQAAKFLDEEIVKWAKVINTAVVKAEQ